MIRYIWSPVLLRISDPFPLRSPSSPRTMIGNLPPKALQSGFDENATVSPAGIPRLPVNSHDPSPSDIVNPFRSAAAPPGFRMAMASWNGSKAAILKGCPSAHTGGSTATASRATAIMMQTGRMRPSTSCIKPSVSEKE